MPQHALDRLVPYPGSEKEATADALKTALAARAYAVYWQMPDDFLGTLDAALVAQTVGITYLLDHISNEESAAAADVLARRLWREWHDTEGLGLDLIAILEKAGIDRDAVIDAVDPRPSALPDSQDGGDRV